MVFTELLNQANYIVREWLQIGRGAVFEEGGLDVEARGGKIPRGRSLPIFSQALIVWRFCCEARPAVKESMQPLRMPWRRGGAAWGHAAYNRLGAHDGKRKRARLYVSGLP